MSVFRLLTLARRGVLILDELLQDGLFDSPDVLTSHLDGGQLAGGNEGAGADIVRFRVSATSARVRNRVAMATCYQLGSTLKLRRVSLFYDCTLNRKAVGCRLFIRTNRSDR